MSRKSVRTAGSSAVTGCPGPPPPTRPGRSARPSSASGRPCWGRAGRRSRRPGPAHPPGAQRRAEVTGRAIHAVPGSPSTAANAEARTSGTAWLDDVTLTSRSSRSAASTAAPERGADTASRGRMLGRRQLELAAEAGVLLAADVAARDASHGAVHAHAPAASVLSGGEHDRARRPPGFRRRRQTGAPSRPRRPGPRPRSAPRARPPPGRPSPRAPRTGSLGQVDARGGRGREVHRLAGAALGHHPQRLGRARSGRRAG